MAPSCPAWQCQNCRHADVAAVELTPLFEHSCVGHGRSEGVAGHFRVPDLVHDLHDHIEVVRVCYGCGLSV